MLFDRGVLPLCYPELVTTAKFGVIVREADKLYLEIACSLGIEVFVVGSKQPRKLRCREIDGVFCMDISDRVSTRPLLASSLYKHIDNYLKSENARETVEFSLPVRVEVLNTVIVYWKNEPRCEVLIDEEGNTEINYCNEPCVIVVYQQIPSDRHRVRTLMVKDEPPITRWAKNMDKEIEGFK